MILVFGKNGQIATALREILPDATFLSSQEANFLDPQGVVDVLNKIKPTVVINASAYTAVDQAEQEKDKALTINATTPGAIAKWCCEHSATMIHYSTDYVFSGEGERPWLETDPTSPVNWYGETKLRGEKAIQDAGCPAYIFRISWVYSPWGTNFPKTILRLANEREELKIVNDQWGAPTDARDVAKLTAQLANSLEKKSDCPATGIYHLRFEDFQTWYQFAQKIITDARTAGLLLKVQQISPVTSDEFPTAAKRPKNSRLGTTRPLL